MEGNHFTRATGDERVGETGKPTSGDGFEFENNSNWFKSYSMNKVFDQDEVGQKTLRSKVQPSSSLPGHFNLGKAEGIFRTDTNGVHSPPYFDEEIDRNSVAATSAAALTKAIEEAQARIKMAKELLERKKAGIQNRVKLNFNDGVKPEESEEDKIAYKVNRSRKKKSQELCEEVDVPLHVSAGREKNPVGPFQVTADQEVREEVKLSKEIEREMPWKEISSQADHRREEAEVSEAAEHFYEVENTDEHWSTATEVDIPSPVSAVTRNQNAMGPGQVTGEFDEVQKFVTRAEEATRETLWNDLKSSQVNHRQEQADLVEAAEQFYEVENPDKNWATSLEFEDINMVQSLDEEELKEKKIAEELFEKPQQCVEGLKPAEEKDYPEIMTSNGISGASDFGIGGVKSMPDVEVFDLERSDQKQRDSLTKGENEKIVQAFYENDQCETKQTEFLELIKDDKKIRIWGLEDVKHMKKQSSAWEWVEASKPEELEKEQNNAYSIDDTEHRFVNRASWKEIIEETLNELHLGKKIERILANDGESEGNENRGEAGGSEKILEGDASQKEENESREEETCQRVETGRMETRIDPSPGDEEKLNTDLEQQCNQGTNLGPADDLPEQDESDDMSKNQKPALNAENFETVEVSEEVPACEESGSTPEVSDAFLEFNESGNELESLEEEYDMEDGDVGETDGFPQGLELTKIMKPVEDMTENGFLDKDDTENVGRVDMNFVQNPDDQHARQFELVCNPRQEVEELASKMEKVKEDNESEVSVSQEDGERNTDCCDEQRSVDKGITMKASQLSDTSEREGENIALNEEPRRSSSTEKDQECREETPISESAEEKEKSHQETLPSKSVETSEENHRPTVTLKACETNDSLQKEVELEREHLRKIDEAKEKVREREKERIVVERAIREARERAFAEARERAAAERAASGARQRATAEARERVGKTSAEPNNKSVAEKASMEAKLKAERAAVERATAEARERALEKAMSGKFASEGRMQNPQHSASSSRFTNSSNHGGK